MKKLIFLIIFLFPLNLFAKEKSQLYYNGEIFTGEKGRVGARWFVVRGNKFIDIGQEEGIPAKWAMAGEKRDLAGRFVSPGFVDAHIHFVDGGLSLLQADLNGADTPEKLNVALEAASRNKINGWIIARNCHTRFFAQEFFEKYSGEGSPPLFITFNDGHRVFVNRTGLKVLEIDRNTLSPTGGELQKDAEGNPTGILINQAAWMALRKVYDTFSLDIIVRGILAAQKKSLSYGITALGDNTFFPEHLKKFSELADDQLFLLRLSSRSFGAEPMTQFLMKGMVNNGQIRYFGDKYFIDGTLSHEVFSKNSEPFLSEDELKDIFLMMGNNGLAFHTQSEKGTRRLIKVRKEIKGRRKSSTPDVLDHCGICRKDLADDIREAGFAITLLPRLIYNLPEFVQKGDKEEIAKTLQFKELYDVGLDPALTSDWPYGLDVQFPEASTDDQLRYALSPLNAIAAVTSGQTPEGGVLPLAKDRVITIEEAWLGHTTYGAKAIGREDDLGKIAPGFLADFIILEKSPFSFKPEELYQTDVSETFIGGKSVFVKNANMATPTTDVSLNYKNSPTGLTPSPIIGYDPVPGAILGGALFFYPYKEKGGSGSMQMMGAPAQKSFSADVNWKYTNLFKNFSPKASFKYSNFQSRYYGSGLDTKAQEYIMTNPTQFEGSVGFYSRISPRINFGFHSIIASMSDDKSGQIEAQSNNSESRINGKYSALKVEIIRDTRDNFFSTRKGNFANLWGETWFYQAGEYVPRQRLGAKFLQFLPLYAPDYILGLRGEGGVGLGERSYLSAFSLGGVDLLRGYLGQRFRGDHFLAFAAEVRYPIWDFISGATFTEAGRVWLDSKKSDRKIAYTYGTGLRFGLPPDGLIKLRFDFAFAPDESGIFFTFNEAF